MRLLVPGLRGVDQLGAHREPEQETGDEECVSETHEEPPGCDRRSADQGWSCRSKRTVTTGSTFRVPSMSVGGVTCHSVIVRG